MENQIEKYVQGGAGIIRLNRPEAINALSPEMITDIKTALEDWSTDDEVRLVLFEGEGKRGFCAGGDVRWTRQMIIKGQIDVAHRFFSLEYGVNKMIATYHKPVVALTHGVVMGGGIGLAGHAGFRFTSETSRFAMPEGAIGFFADVGVQSLLAQIPRHRALMFMLSGEVVNAQDALALNLSDAIYDENQIDALRDRILRTASAVDVAGGLEELLDSNQRAAGVAHLCETANSVAHCFESEDCVKIVGELKLAAENSKALQILVVLIEKRCPTSAWVHLLARGVAQKSGDIASVLENDLRLAKYMAGRNDMIEGVRAVLVDKDHTPKWQPAGLEQVDVATIKKVLNVLD